MTFVLTGLDIEAKADLTLAIAGGALGGAGAVRRVRRPAHPLRQARRRRPTPRPPPSCGSPSRTPTPNGGPPLLRRGHRTGPRRLSRSPPDRPADCATAYGVFWPALVPADLVVPTVVHADGRRMDVPHHRRPCAGPRWIDPGAEPARPGAQPRTSYRPPTRRGRPRTGPPSPAARHAHRRPVRRQGRQRQRGAVGPLGRRTGPWLDCLPHPRRASGPCCPRPTGSRSGDSPSPTCGPSTSSWSACSARGWPPPPGPIPRPRAWASTFGADWSTSRSTRPGVLSWPLRHPG